MEDLGGANERVEKDLLAIRSRLAGTKAVQGDGSQTGEERLLQAVKSRPTSAARSEYFAEKDKLWRLTHDRVGEIHRFLLETGKTGKDLPDYEEAVGDNLWTPEELEKRYGRKDGKFDVFADRDPGPLAKDEEAERKERLYLAVVEPERTLFLRFDLRIIFLLR